MCMRVCVKKALTPCCEAGVDYCLPIHRGTPLQAWSRLSAHAE